MPIALVRLGCIAAIAALILVRGQVPRSATGVLPLPSVSTPTPSSVASVTPIPRTPAPTSTPQSTPRVQPTLDPTPVSGRLIRHGSISTNATTLVVVFWLPRGWTYDSTRGNAMYEHVALEMARDIGRGLFVPFLRQYDASMPMYARVLSRVVTSTYPVPATETNPLRTHDIDNMLNFVIARLHSPAGVHTHYLVYLARNAWTCDNDATNCQPNNGFDGFHTAFYVGSQPVLYAVMSDFSRMDGLVLQSPHRDPLIDYETVILAHEELEMATDGLPGSGWIAPQGAEIADLCDKRGPQRVSLPTGQSWLLPLAWSNSTGNCAPPT